MLLTVIIKFLLATILLCTTTHAVILKFDDIQRDPECKVNVDASSSSSSSGDDHNTQSCYVNPISPLPVPYHNYNFTKRDQLPFSYISVLNTDLIDSFYFKTIAVSPPNVMTVDKDEITITHKNKGWRFSFISVVMTNVYQQNIRMYISRGKDWPVYPVNLQMRIPRLITLDWHNIDNITIGCVDPDSDDCGYVAYDNFILD